MKDETRNDVLAAEPEQETKKIPQPEETEEPQYDLEEILEEALEEQYTPPAQEAEETPEAPQKRLWKGKRRRKPEPEEIPVPETDVESEEEQEETERFIQEQVTSALGGHLQ